MPFNRNCLPSTCVYEPCLICSGSKKVRATTPKKTANEILSTPYRAGDVTIENLGTIIPRSPYVNSKYIYPVGFVR